ncbi:MAG TPA: serine/threonine-protein kinase [Kofleriaceae bacterium]|nr:serine/threonine-protein kinase [Kofleriaceae bacterium]
MRSGTSGLANAADALRLEEVKRTRALLQLSWIIALGLTGAILIAPGNPRIARALIAVLGVGVVGSFWLYRELANPARYSASRMNVLALLAVVAGQLGILYVGAFSAAPIMVSLGLYFFCRTESLRSAIAIYVLAAGAHAVTAALVVSRVLDDPGFYPIGDRASVQAQIAGQGLMQFAYALCFWLARVTRKTSLKSIEHLQKATRLAAQRDVQLNELRHDLDRALKVGGPGRFTGVVVGTWELGVVLGRGAMGEVYAATSTQTEGQQSAVKLLRRELLADPRHVERFLREVRIASSIDSRHVVRVLEASTPSDPVPFLAMEKLEGQTLASLLRKGRSLSDSSLEALVAQVCDVLELARAAGIVHRDIKPQNLFLTFDDVWKVLDFGVALLSDSSGTLTQGAAVGTPAYMSPEQARGAPVDHRADVYAMGAVIYRCVTGRVPFARPDTPSLLFAVVQEMPVRPSAIAKSSPQLDAVLQIALAKDRDARFATARDLADAFTAASRNDLPYSTLHRAKVLQPWAEPPPVTPTP